MSAINQTKLIYITNQSQILYLYPNNIGLYCSTDVLIMEFKDLIHYSPPLTLVETINGGLSSLHTRTYPKLKHSSSFHEIHGPIIANYH